MDEQMSCGPCARCGRMPSNAGSGLCMFCAQETLADTVRRIGGLLLPLPLSA